ncbi:MAG: A/G-specific adenine glycosylase [Candidatus Nanopelagicales bacterium]|nr:A/G-specific adenine glycosylase [Candidatus Nanopelagicales bacterium]
MSTSNLDPQTVITWFASEARTLPWRDTSPWGVLVSEFMLQQTPVNRVLPRWQLWLERWPTPQELANCSVAEAIRTWGNLGYPRRAKRLHESATIISQQFDGEVPTTYEGLISLPGVGEYTANAVLAFAFGQRSLVLDVNVRRLLARAGLGQSHQAPTVSLVERSLAQELLPTSHHQCVQWSAASMELGALICTARDPSCSKCPIVNDCKWFAQGKPLSSIPKRRQARYEGSVRQERGRILKILRENEKPMSVSELSQHTPDNQRFENALTQLASEAMITKVGSNYALPNS